MQVQLTKWELRALVLALDLYETPSDALLPSSMGERAFRRPDALQLSRRLADVLEEQKC